MLPAILHLKHILIECADWGGGGGGRSILNRSLYRLFRNVSPEIIFDFLREIGVFYKIWSMLRKWLWFTKYEAMDVWWSPCSKSRGCHLILFSCLVFFLPSPLILEVLCHFSANGLFCWLVSSRKFFIQNIFHQDFLWYFLHGTCWTARRCIMWYV